MTFVQTHHKKVGAAQDLGFCVAVWTAGVIIRQNSDSFRWVPCLYVTLGGLNDTDGVSICPRVFEDINAQSDLSRG